MKLPPAILHRPSYSIMNLERKDVDHLLPRDGALGGQGPALVILRVKSWQSSPRDDAAFAHTPVDHQKQVHSSSVRPK